MDMPLDEAGQQHLALQVDDPRARTDECLHAGLVTDIDDMLAFHGHGLDPRLLDIDGVDWTVSEYDVRASIRRRGGLREGVTGLAQAHGGGRHHRRGLQHGPARHP